MKRKKEKLTTKIIRWCISLAWILFVVLMACECEDTKILFKEKIIALMYGFILYIITKKLTKNIKI